MYIIKIVFIKILKNIYVSNQGPLDGLIARQGGIKEMTASEYSNETFDRLSIAAA